MSWPLPGLPPERLCLPRDRVRRTRQLDRIAARSPTKHSFSTVRPDMPKLTISDSQTRQNERLMHILSDQKSKNRGGDVRKDATRARGAICATELNGAYSRVLYKTP